MSSPYKTFSYYTFGCKVNFADSSYIANQLIGLGMSQVPFDNYADFCFINTCSVTENADRKARKIIKKINEKFPETKIVVLGCFAQLKPTDISKIKGVHNVVEPAIYGNIICFGPNYEILNEAVELVNRKLAFPVNNSEELSGTLKLINENDQIDKYKIKLNKYLLDQSKFSEKIVGDIF